MSVRAKFFVAGLRDCSYDDQPAKEVKLYGVFTHQDEREGNACEENHVFGKWTPAADIRMIIVNPGAFEQFELHKEFYVDFTEAEK